MKAQINNDLLKNSKRLSHSLIFKSSSIFDRNINDSKFKKKNLFPLLSVINDEEPISWVLLILNLLLFIFFLGETFSKIFKIT